MEGTIPQEQKESLCIILSGTHTLVAIVNRPPDMAASRRSTALLTAFVGLGSLTHANYVWPSKYDQLDDLLYMQSGYIRNGQLSDRTSDPTNMHVPWERTRC